MNGADIRATAIANEVYPMLVECAENSSIDVADLIRELHAKQQMINIRAALGAEKRAEAAN